MRYTITALVRTPDDHRHERIQREAFYYSDACALVRDMRAHPGTFLHVSLWDGQNLLPVPPLRPSWPA